MWTKLLKIKMMGKIEGVHNFEQTRFWLSFFFRPLPFAYRPLSTYPPQ
jgi:hypothetical protein